MSVLSARDIELVALGSAVGSNCVRCVEHHIGEARQAGLDDDVIRAALDLAEKVRQVSGQNARNAAHRALGGEAASTQSEPAPSPCSAIRAPGGRCC